jgi:hypothetical protein
MSARQTQPKGCGYKPIETVNSIKTGDSAARFRRTSGRAKVEWCFLLDERTPLFRCPRFAVGDVQTFQDDPVPLSHGFLVSLRALAAFVPAVRACPAEFIDSFGYFHEQFILFL